MSWVREWSEMRDTMHQGKIADPVQDPKLFQPVTVRVVRPFCVRGRRLEIGEEVDIAYHVAIDLKAMGKAELLN